MACCIDARRIPVKVAFGDTFTGILSEFSGLLVDGGGP